MIISHRILRDVVIYPCRHIRIWHVCILTYMRQQKNLFTHNAHSPLPFHFIYEIPNTGVLTHWQFIGYQSGYSLSQWEQALQCNAFSHWPSQYSEWSLFVGTTLSNIDARWLMPFSGWRFFPPYTCNVSRCFTILTGLLFHLWAVIDISRAKCYRKSWNENSKYN